MSVSQIPWSSASLMDLRSISVTMGRLTLTQRGVQVQRRLAHTRCDGHRPESPPGPAKQDQRGVGLRLAEAADQGPVGHQERRQGPQQGAAAPAYREIMAAST
ncbi:hypothetical protein K456DRAFT_733920 [Colletotrichum gloeosporioides 23]|nr:hypothetical protein K456DRAFT_733920 [Colletotrichum gloeosporioides 23]